MKFEQFTVNPFEAGRSPEKSDEELQAEMIALVEHLLAHQTSKIGEGRTAEVHLDAPGSDRCFKIVLHPERADYTNRIRKEGMLLDEVRSVGNGEVKIPEPQFYIDAVHYEKNEHGKAVEKETRVLIMERLNAISLADILNGDEMPAQFATEAFFRETFFPRLRAFVERMHGLSVFHRDLHEGNIMIDLEDGSPCVIDFGAGTHASEEDAYEDRNTTTGETVVFTETDEEKVHKTEIAILGYLKQQLTQAA